MRNVTCLNCKAWSNNPFKVQADLWTEKTMVVRESKGWEGFLVILKVKNAQLYQKEPQHNGGQIHCQWTPGEVTLLHMMVTCLQTLNRATLYFRSLFLYPRAMVSRHVGASTFHKPPEYLPNRDKLDANCVVNKHGNFSLIRPGFESRLLSLTRLVTSDKWTMNTASLNSCYLRIVVRIKWIMLVKCSADYLAHSKHSNTNSSSKKNKNNSNCDGSRSRNVVARTVGVYPSVIVLLIWRS